MALTLSSAEIDALRVSLKSQPALLELLGMTGCIVKSDAIGYQTAIAEAIKAQGADYVLALKENQESLFAAVTLTVWTPVCMHAASVTPLSPC